MRRETRRFVLQDELAREVERILRKTCTGVEGEEVGYVWILLKCLPIYARGLASDGYLCCSGRPTRKTADPLHGTLVPGMFPKLLPPSNTSD